MNSVVVSNIPPAFAPEKSLPLMKFCSRDLQALYFAVRSERSLGCGIRTAEQEALAGKEVLTCEVYRENDHRAGRPEI